MGEFIGRVCPGSEGGRAWGEATGPCALAALLEKWLTFPCVHGKGGRSHLDACILVCGLKRRESSLLSCSSTISSTHP